MKKWINNLSFALWTTAALATGTAFAQTLPAAAAAAFTATAHGKRPASPGTGALQMRNGDNDKPHVLTPSKQHATATGN